MLLLILIFVVCVIYGVYLFKDFCNRAKELERNNRIFLNEYANIMSKYINTKLKETEDKKVQVGQQHIKVGTRVFITEGYGARKIGTVILVNFVKSKENKFEDFFYYEVKVEGKVYPKCERGLLIVPTP